MHVAYWSQRSTINHVFICRLIIEITLSAKNKSMLVLLLDISQSFDSINREMLIKTYSTPIEADKLHIVYQLLNMTPSLKGGKNTSDTFKADTGELFKRKSIYLLSCKSTCIVITSLHITTRPSMHTTSNTNKHCPTYWSSTPIQS